MRDQDDESGLQKLGQVARVRGSYSKSVWGFPVKRHLGYQEPRNNTESYHATNLTQFILKKPRMAANDRKQRE